MLDNLKALVVVLPLAIAMFIVAKPICLRFMAEADFARRRNTWLALTVAAFVIPNFWLFALVAAGILAWSAHKESNVIALYLLVLLAAPPPGLQIPTVLINQLFELTYYRILSLAILIPMACRLIRTRTANGKNPFAATDSLIIAYGLLQVVLLMPYESITNTMRRGFLFAIDALALYYVASRTCRTRPAVAEAMACFFLACAISVPIAIVETIKSWVLYAGLGVAWGLEGGTAYLFRDGSLRAQAAAGHSLTLGYVLAIGFGFWLYLRTKMRAPSLGYLGAAWMWAGLLAAYSRSPWLVAVSILFAHIALGPRGSVRFLVSAGVAALVGAAVLATPLGDQIVDKLPFVGTVEQDNVAYRQQLAAVAWELIQERPLFGTPGVMTYLEGMRQGGGIIDLVNVYATIAMFYGLVGLALFLGFFLAGMRAAYRCAKAPGSPADSLILGSTLVACMLGTLLMMTSGGFGSSLAIMYWTLPGLAVGYAQASAAEEVAVKEASKVRVQPRWLPGRD